jgi:hypothetical protein
MQSYLHTFSSGNDRAKAIAMSRSDPPADSELPGIIAPNEHYSFDTESVDGISQLRRRIRDAEYAVDRVEAWSFLLGDYITYRNEKFTSEIATFNMSSATDCVNLGTKMCQVESSSCFAARNERDFPYPIHHRRKQEILWNHIDPVTWAKAFRRHADRKDNPVTTIRFNEAGDFKTQHDIWRVDEIARRLPNYNVFTYSASSYLNWDSVEHFTVNASDTDHDYGDRHYKVVDDKSEVPDDGVLCPYDRTDGKIHCGECVACITDHAPDVYVEKFEGSNR